MSPPANHNKLIDQAARAILKPMGCAQKGRSRLWFDDQGWWVGVIEFQPGAWNRGSYLNVGAMWLWYAKDYWSFDDGYRIEAFHAYGNDEQFSGAAAALAERAAQEVARMRRDFASMESVAIHLRSRKKVTAWDHFHSAVAASLAGNLEDARSGFAAVANAPDHAPWVAELQEKAALLARRCDCVESMRLAVEEVVADARSRLKLPACPAPLLPSALRKAASPTQ